MNCKTQERNSKTKSTVFSKELTNYTPLMLAVAGENEDAECVEIVKLLFGNEKVEKNCKDFDKNNILHLAVKLNKILTAKYLATEMNNLLGESNSDGQSPITIAQNNNCVEIINFFKSLDKKVMALDDELLEMLENKNSKNKKKTKKNKKNEKEFFGLLLGSTEYEDVLKPKEKLKEKIIEENKGNEEKIEKIEEKKNEIIKEIISNKENIQPPQHKVINVNKDEYEAHKLKEKLLKEKKEKEILILEQAKIAKELEKSKKIKNENKEKKEKKGKFNNNLDTIINISNHTNTTDVTKNKIKFEELNLDHKEKIEITNKASAEESKTKGNVIGIKSKKQQDIKIDDHVKEATLVTPVLVKPLETANIIIEKEVLSIVNEDKEIKKENVTENALIVVNDIDNKIIVKSNEITKNFEELLVKINLI